MNLIERLRYKKSEEYIDYKKQLELNKYDIVRFNEYYQDSKRKLDDLINSNSQDLKEINRLKQDMQRWLYEYQNSVLMSNFIRPNTIEEIKKRKDIQEVFVNNLINIVGNDSDLRFHGTPIYLAGEIIKSGNISSTADRYDGYINSTDEAGYISASSINSLGRTINYFTDFSSYHRCLPCGVLFVLNEKEGDFDLRSRDEMHSVNFKTNPEQLNAIVCTDEVKPMVINWCNKYKLDASKVFSFEEYLEYEKENKINKSR